MVYLGLVMVNSLFVYLLGVISLLMALLVPFSFLLIYTLYQSAKPYVVGFDWPSINSLFFGPITKVKRNFWQKPSKTYNGKS